MFKDILTFLRLDNIVAMLKILHFVVPGISISKINQIISEKINMLKMDVRTFW